MQVDFGWSTRPESRTRYAGGPVAGRIAPDTRHGLRLVADTPAPGLEPSAAPSMDDIPNNHRMYAIQWFAFAVSALAIYLLARRRQHRGASLAPNAAAR